MEPTHNVPLTTKQAAARLGISPSWLAARRHKGDIEGPPFVRLGVGAIRYLPADLDLWIASRTRHPRSTRGEALDPESFDVV
jgi:predicted DNA-binding transcriptional regulator AlpA